MDIPPPNVENPPPVYRRLITQEEVTEFNGKLNSLRQLMIYPRAYDPPVFEVLFHIEQSYNTLIGYAELQHNQARRDRIEEQIRIVRILENMIVQHIVQGVPWPQLRDEANTAYRSRFRNPTQWLFIPRPQ